MTLGNWRRIHGAATAVVGLLGLAHSVLTFAFYPRWTAGAAWFLGAGLGLVLLAAVNGAVLTEARASGATTRVVCVANWSFVVFGLAAAWAVPQPQAFVVVAGLVGQALAGFRTLRPT